ncbi:hypothetical protein [Azospirillum sp. TSO22-1]|uniref:hypothetical protein n=1 Tax=Azospirillum sp. TSO22-1 TaxID=716789 RepID=UPI0011B7F812|nr:hypothetical protein [Azospirillum sp. TSO22-1]
MPDEISVVDPGHPLYGRRFRLHTITNAMRTCGIASRSTRPSATSPQSRPSCRPRNPVSILPREAQDRLFAWRKTVG